jgi:membrane protein
MPAVKERLARLRRRFPFLDHVLSTQEHYTKVKGSQLAGAVTYFGFLSFFPILALAFSVVGYISVAFPDARDSLVTAIEELFPGIVSSSGGAGTISLKDIESAKVTAGIIGFLVLLYSGLGWLSGLRVALEDAFEEPRSRKASFVIGKATDLATLAVIGTVMIMSVGISGTVTGLADSILGSIGLDDVWIGTPLLWALGVLLGLAFSTLLFWVMYKLLANPDLPARPLIQGAVFAAIAFELLKWLVVNVIGTVGGSAFAPLAISVTLVVWINYCSRLVVYGASWAMTSHMSHDALARRAVASEAAVVLADLAPVNARIPVSAPQPVVSGRFDLGSALVGAAAGAVAAFVINRTEE